MAIARVSTSTQSEPDTGIPKSAKIIAVVLIYGTRARFGRLAIDWARRRRVNNRRSRLRCSGSGEACFSSQVFTLFFGVDQKLAIGASAVAVATNSVVGSTVHLESRFTNLRFAMMMEVTTAIGALVGAIVGVWAPEQAINFIFASVLVYAAVSMAIKRASSNEFVSDGPDPHGLAGELHDPATNRTVRYIPQRLQLGLSMSTIAGVMSGMLGVGGGVIKVPVMNVLMRVP